MTNNRTIVEAIGITATISLIIAAALFYVLHRLITARRIGRTSRLDSSFRREAPPAMQFLQHGSGGGGPIKGVIVDEEGLDVVYLRKLECAHFPGCFSKVWHNPLVEEAKRMEPIQKFPLLHGHVRSGQESHENEDKKPSSVIDRPAAAAPPPPPAPPPRKETKPPPPPLPPKMKPAPPLVKRNGVISLCNPPVVPPRGKGVGDEAEAALDKERSKEKGAQMKLKPLHWDKVIANADHSMVWNELSDGSFRFDDDLMEALFGYKKTAIGKGCEKPSCHGSSASLPSAPTFLLDPRKSQNTAIVVKSLSVSREEILNALLEGQGLNADTLEKLTKICPTQDEMAKILELKGNPTKLADAELFLYHILKAIPSAFIRVNAMLFRTTYDPEILHLKQSLQTLELACKELRNGGIFFKLLEAILKAGNRMNAGTNRGNAQGFNLTTLRRLSDVRSTDGKTTLLHFVVEQVVRSEGRRCLINREDTSTSDAKNNSDEETGKQHLTRGLRALESLNTDFANVKKAASIDWDGLITTCPVLATRANEIRRLLTRCDDLEPGGFLTITKGFLEDCQAELTVVQDEEKRVMDVVGKTTVYFQAGGAKDREGKNPLQLFAIVKDFLSNVDQVCAEIQQKVQKTRVATTVVSSSPPLSPTMRSPVRFQNLELYMRAQRNGTTSDSDSEDDF